MFKKQKVNWNNEVGILIRIQAIPQITTDFKSLPDIGWYGSAYQLTRFVSPLVTSSVYGGIHTSPARHSNHSAGKSTHNSAQRYASTSLWQAEVFTDLTHLVVFPHVLLHLRTRLSALRRRPRFGHVDCRQSSRWYRFIWSDQWWIDYRFCLLACSQTACCDWYPDFLLPARHRAWSYFGRSFHRIRVLALV